VTDAYNVMVTVFCPCTGTVWYVYITINSCSIELPGEPKNEPLRLTAHIFNTLAARTNLQDLFGPEHDIVLSPYSSTHQLYNTKWRHLEKLTIRFFAYNNQTEPLHLINHIIKCLK